MISQYTENMKEFLDATANLTPDEQASYFGEHFVVPRLLDTASPLIVDTTGVILGKEWWVNALRLVTRSLGAHEIGNRVHLAMMGRDGMCLVDRRSVTDALHELAGKKGRHSPPVFGPRSVSPADIRAWVVLLSIMTNDDESAHIFEDCLHRRLLKAIRDDRCVDPRGCAAEALKTRNIEFSRWCA